MSARHRTIRWIGLSVLLLTSVWVLWRLVTRLTRFGATAEARQLWLPVLSLLLVVMALALAGVLIRNLVKLIVDRKRGILGSRLRTKLVFFFLALVLLPATILFLGSGQVIKETVEAILRAPIESLGESVARWNEYFRDQALQRARAIAGEVAAHEQAGVALDPAFVEALLASWGKLEGAWQARVTDPRGRVVATTDGLAGSPWEGLRGELDGLLDAVAMQAVSAADESARIDYLGQGLVALGAVPVSGDRVRGVVAVAVLLPQPLAESLQEINAEDRAYRQFRVQRRELVRMYVSVIALIFLVTLFVATWVGMYLSRRITEPVRDLASAAREISAGNLGVRVRTDVGDEMGVLVEEFNQMAAQLHENREVITRSTADLRRSNLALDERRRYIETLLANLSTAVISLDTHGCVTTTNPAVRAVLGHGLAPGDDAKSIFRAHDLDPLAELLERRSSRGGDVLRHDLTLARASGALHVSVQVTPLRGPSAEDLGTLVMVEDLTEFVRVQRAAAWREIARRIAHEIKNPLTPIQLAAQRLRRKFATRAEDLAEVVPQATDAIEREVGALKRLVDEFSRFARMPEIAPREVDPVEVVESVLALYQGSAAIEWDVVMDRDAGLVRLDPEQLRRVLINLIDNALAAIEGHGEIQVRLRHLDSEGILRFEVADNGAGIPVEDRDKMFLPYFSTKRRGTGLGLAIVHRIVTDHGGVIRVKDNEPAGARFVIDLPLQFRAAHRVS